MKEEKFTDVELVQAADLEKISTIALEGDQAIVGGAVGYPLHWARFTVETPSAQTIKVNTGLLFADDIVYELDEFKSIDLLSYLPTVVGDQRYVAVLVRGVEETLSEEREIFTDVDTDTTTFAQTPKTHRYGCEFVIQQGDRSPTPIKPEIASTNCCLCWVLLGTAGIIGVESSNDHRVKTLYEVEGRVTVLEGQMAVAYARTTSLQTDLANLQAAFKVYPKPGVIMQIQRDVAYARRALAMPDAARNYWYDPVLVADCWDTTHALWLARIDQGLRFPFAAENQARIEVLDETDTAIRIKDDILMPAWDDVVFLEITGSGGGSKNISEKVYQETTKVERSISSTRTDFGKTIAVCTNIADYALIGTARAGETYAVDGDTFQNLGTITNTDAAIDLSLLNSTHNWDLTVEDIVQYNATVAETGYNAIYATRQVITSSYTTTYWDYVTTTSSVNGSVYGEVWLQTQPKIVTGVSFYFDRVAATGDVTLTIYETDAQCVPLTTASITSVTLTPADLAVGWVEFPIRPSYFAPGKSYAAELQTTGNHAIHYGGNTNENDAAANPYSQGYLYWKTGGGAISISTGEDLWMRVHAAQYRATRTSVECQPLTLENGMTQISLIYPGWEPDGTSMPWSVQPSGETTWTTVAKVAEGDGPFGGQPALTRLAVTFIGTTDLQAGIQLGARCVSRTQRHQTQMHAVTKPLLFGLSSDSIVLETQIADYDASLHTVGHRLVVGATIHAPDAETIEPLLGSNSKVVLRSTFSLATATTEARYVIDATTTTAKAVCFGEYAYLYAM